MTFEIILGIILAGIFSNNYPLLHFLGTGAVLENERSNRRSLVLGLGTTVVMILATLVTWPLNKYVLAEVPYLQTLAFVVVVLAVVALFDILEHQVIERFCHVDFTKFAINGALLGLCIHNTELGFVEALVTALGVGIGFTLMLALFSALEHRLDEDAVPEAFHGLPIHLLTAGMIVLALLCF